MIRTLRRRRSAPAAVSTAASGGTWTFTPGAGTLSSLVVTVTPAPGVDQVGLDLTAGAGGVGKILMAYVDVGNTTATSAGTATVAAGEAVQVVVGNFDGGAFQVSGRVTFIAVNGSATTYNLLSQAV